jgi:glutamate 5-kinase
LTDVDGVYDLPPKDPNAKLIPLYRQTSEVAIGEKSSQGRGGMASKIGAAISAVKPGSRCNACVVAAGSDLDSIRAILGQKNDYGTKGTLFVTPGSDLEQQAFADATMIEVCSIFHSLGWFATVSVTIYSREFFCVLFM